MYNDPNEEIQHLSEHKHAESETPSSTRTKLSLELVNSIIMLLALYIVQQTLSYYYDSSLSLVLADQGAQYAELGILKIIGIPLGFKVLFAPLLDVFYNAKFGKRKTYIVPLVLFIGCLTLLVSFFINNWIETYTASLWKIVTTGMVIQLFNGIEDVALDGWLLTLFPSDDYSKSASTQVAGSDLGALFGYYFFIPLNSEEFCNKYIFDTPRTTPLLTSQILLLIVAVTAFGLTIWVAFFKKERNPSKNEYKRLKDMLVLFKSFYQNKNLRLLGIWSLTSPFSLMAIQESSKVSLVRNGMSKSDISNIGLICLPVNLLLCWILPKYIKKDTKNIMWSNISMFARLVLSVGIFFTYINFDANRNYNRTWYLWLLFKMGDTIAHSMKAIYNMTFNQIIADVEIGASFVTSLNVLGKIGYVGWDIISLFILQYVDQYIVAIFCWVAGAIYFATFARYVSHILDNEPKENFRPQLIQISVPYSEIPADEEPVQENGDHQNESSAQNVFAEL